MNKINVIDLDCTLLPYDSFRKLVKIELRKLNLYIWIISILRILKVIQGYRYKQLLVLYWENKYDKSFFYNYAKLIYKDLDKNILNIVSSKTDSNTKNILISASPELYVKELIVLLGWEGRGSYYKNKKFINLYSKEKINWLIKNYPKNEVEYNFAISDSQSDVQLLALFQESTLWIQNDNK
jgi:hypothetical protein